jgi:hypothetical protein
MWPEWKLGWVEVNCKEGLLTGGSMGGVTVTVE